MAWRLLRNRIRDVNWLEAVDRNCICPGIHLEGKEFPGTSQYFVETTVKLRQSPDQSILSSRRGRSVMRRRQHQALRGRLNPVQEHCWRNLVRIQELSMEAEMSFVQNLSGRDTRIILWNRTEVEHDQR